MPDALTSLSRTQANSYNQSHTTHNKLGEEILTRPSVSRAERDWFRNTLKPRLCWTCSLPRVNPTRAGHPAVPSLSGQDPRGPLMSLNTQTRMLCPCNPSIHAVIQHRRSISRVALGKLAYRLGF